MTDPIADMLTRIRNAQSVKKAEVDLPYSKMKEHIANILVAEGYLAGAGLVEEGSRKQLRLNIKYVNKQPAIRSLRRVSTPGRRVYVGSKKLPYVFDDLGIAIISTSQGLMTNKDARAQKIGGEVICEVF